MSGPGWPIFGRYAVDVRPIGPVVSLGNAGGLSGARLYRSRSGRGELVARCWPEDGRTLNELETIHSYLRKTGDLGFVPVPLITLDGRTLVEVDGRAWEVSPWLPGTADLGRPPTSEHIRLAFGGLAAFLTRLADRPEIGPSPGLAQRVADLGRLRKGDFARIRARIALNPADPASSLARRWLDRAASLADQVFEATRAVGALSLPLQPCLRDARPHHFLFEGSRLAGLVDFGSMGVDSVAGDLARLLAEGIGPDRSARSEALAAFEATRPLSSDELRAIEAFERANALLAPSVWIYWHFFEGRTFDQPDAAARGLERCLARLDETL